MMTMVMMMIMVVMMMMVMMMMMKACRVRICPDMLTALSKERKEKKRSDTGAQSERIQFSENRKVSGFSKKFPSDYAVSE